MDQQTMTVLSIVIGIVAAVIVAADVVICVVWVVSLLRRTRVFAPKWSVLHVFLGGQIGLIVFAILSLAIMIPFVISGSITTGSPEELRQHMGLVGWIAGAQEAVMIAVPLVFFMRYRVRLRDLGISMRYLTKGILLGVAWFVPVYAAVCGLELGSRMLTDAILSDSLRQRITQIQQAFDASQFFSGGKMSTGELLIILAVAGFIIPIVEEILFRGFLYNCCRARWGVRWAVAISAVIFASIHGQVLMAMPFLFISVALAICYERTRTLIAPITVHCLNNSAAVLLVGLGVLKP